MRSNAGFLPLGCIVLYLVLSCPALRTRTVDAQPPSSARAAPRFILTPPDRTATNVSFGTICVDVPSNTSEFWIPMNTGEFF
jgi:hypothetical protein